MIEKMDEIDRVKQPAVDKLDYLLSLSSSNPVHEGMHIVGRPRVILQLLIDLGVTALNHIVRLNQSFVYGETGGDIVAWYKNVPITVRCSASSDNIFLIHPNHLTPSNMNDRRKAAELRVHAHSNKLENLRNTGGN